MNYHTHGAEYARFTGRPEEGPGRQYPDTDGVNAIVTAEVIHCLEKIEKRIKAECPHPADDPFTDKLAEIARGMSDVIWDSFTDRFIAEVRS